MELENEVISTEQQTNHQEIEQKIVARIPKGWGSYIRCHTGWYPLLDDLDGKISYLAPNYEIHQVKEKYGTLRFYIGGPVKDKMTAAIIEDLISYAEELSSIICESCGAARYGKIRTRYDETVALRDNGWMKTLCNSCALLENYPLDEDSTNE
jgi:hypothetical protein